MVLSGIFSSEHVDRTGERIIIEGMDVSHLQGPTAVVNYEHQSDTPSSILGRVISCKKILKDEDCKNKFEKQCYESVNKVPCIVGSVELFSDPEDDHQEARALAGIVKSYKRKNLPLPIAFSIEGASIQKEGPLIKRSVAKTVALTFKPANESCTLDQLELSKSEKDVYLKMEKASQISNPTFYRSAQEILP